MTVGSRSRLVARVARFLLVHDTKAVKNQPNEHKMFQVFIDYPKCLL
jgi:hypothetical protein